MNQTLAALAVSRDSDVDWDLSLKDIYLALAAQVPVEGAWADNPHKTWADVNPDLPAIEILAYGPPPTSGTRDAFVELAMREGCKELAFVHDGGFDKAWVKENCSRTLPTQIFIWADSPERGFASRTSAAILVLLGFLITMNAVAIFLRSKFERKW